ncbi:hypothetical protein F0T03_11965 [Yersinia canariae]|uniref:Uncharacterized protein n=1 Tax=Yersinia canariae TaxID=2607663 RepID=A0A857EZF1_9GAMM|nr:hypothetical protein F0T03_11965 [Yersinia canariae]
MTGVNECSQRTCSLKYGGYKADKEKPVEAAAATGFLLLFYRLLISRFLSRHLLLLNISSFEAVQTGYHLSSASCNTQNL